MIFPISGSKSRNKSFFTVQERYYKCLASNVFKWVLSIGFKGWDTLFITKLNTIYHYTDIRCH